MPALAGLTMAADLDGRRVVVTAGGTREPIDPVRFLGNRSSGKMGNALARAAVDAGASVRLITTAPIDHLDGADIVRVSTAQEMHDAVWSAMDDAEVLLMAAAVADYRPRDVAARKLKKSGSGMTLELIPTIDILTALRRHPRHRDALIVGFAAETDDLEANATSKLQRKGLDLIVLNDVGAPGIGMGADDNAVTVLDAGGVVSVVERMPKSEVARRLIVLVAQRLVRAR